MFELPLIVPSLNAQLRAHWSLRRNLKQTLWAHLLAHRPSQKATTHRTVTITRCGGKLMDHDNLAGAHKPLLDCLVQAGFLVDDSPKWVTVSYRQDPGGVKRTLVEVA